MLNSKAENICQLQALVIGKKNHWLPYVFLFMYSFMQIARRELW